MSITRGKYALVASVVAAGVMLSGCSGSDDGGAKPKETAPTLAPEEALRQIRCDVFMTYVEIETGRGPKVDQAYVDGVQRNRLQQLDRLLATYKSGVPAEIQSAADALRALAPTTNAETTPKQDAIRAALKPLTDALDPQCDTVGGMDKSETTRTTRLLPEESTTTAAGGAPATTAPATTAGATTTVKQ